MRSAKSGPSTRFLGNVQIRRGFGAVHGAI
jgi:hypothetical protein